MYSLYKKELAVFFSSLTGYLVILLYLLVTGLFLWIIPGQSNLFEAGYANLDTFFSLSPWLFMFLIPAVTMRLFPEELKSGTIELLLTRPLTELNIVVAKYLASFSIVVISVLPTLVYYFSVYKLGNPPGNIDTGGTWGSYIGLVLMAALFVSMGTFASSITDNQIIAFLAGIFIIFVFYLGFEMSAGLFAQTKAEYFLEYLSINRHFASLSRGVIDTRDVVYFAGLIVLFITLTKVRLQSRKW